MRKIQLTNKLARQSGVTKAEAADQLEGVVHQIVTTLRKGKPVNLPGLGRFQPGGTWQFKFEKGHSHVR
jgi:nucleoid DNA-binding protein